MDTPLFSQQWYRVSGLAPRVRPDILSSRHLIRNKPWFVLKGANLRSIRINSAAHYFVSRFDSVITVGEIWEEALVTLGDEAPTQDELISLIGDLFESNIIDFKQASDLDQLFDNQQDRTRAQAKSRYGNPLFMRFTLFDPDRLTRLLLPWFGWLFQRATLWLWLGAMIAAVLCAAYAWEDLGQAFSSDLLSRRNLVIMWFVFPLMKVVHELAHALAVRRFGGEVRECGIALLVLLPVPFVDASDSARFSNKYQRMAVSAAGIIVETALAALGLAVWMTVEPGLVRDIALNVAITGSLSSVLFNGNPLLKFDAYYVLSDAIEVPNLATRASRYPLYLVQRYALGLDVRSPATDRGERGWLLGYGFVAAIYRVALTAAICLYVASHYFFIGVALAIWAAAVQLAKPLWSVINFVWRDTQVRQHRLRVNAVVGTTIGAIVFTLFFLQVPNTTTVRGIVWPVDQAVVRATSDCFVLSVAVPNGNFVPAGTPLLTCIDPERDADLASVRADMLIARATLDSTRDRVERQLHRTELEKARQLLAQAQARQTRTVVTSALDGSVYLPEGENLVGRFVEQGAVVGYVLNRENISIRTLLAQERVELLDKRLDAVDARMVRGPGVSQPTSILRRVPAASDHLGIAALGEEGGGDLPVLPDDSGNLLLARSAFELELELPLVFLDTLVGEPVELRFDHGSSSTASIMYRKLQLLLLSKFNV